MEVTTAPSNENFVVKSGACVDVGGREYQEDRVVIIHDLNAFGDFSGIELLLLAAKVLLVEFEFV